MPWQSKPFSFYSRMPSPQGHTPCDVFKDAGIPHTDYDLLTNMPYLVGLLGEWKEKHHIYLYLFSSHLPQLGHMLPLGPGSHLILQGTPAPRSLYTAVITPWSMTATDPWLFAPTMRCIPTHLWPTCSLLLLSRVIPARSPTLACLTIFPTSILHCLCLL